MAMRRCQKRQAHLGRLTYGSSVPGLAPGPAFGVQLEASRTLIGSPVIRIRSNSFRIRVDFDSNRREMGLSHLGCFSGRARGDHHRSPLTGHPSPAVNHAVHFSNRHPVIRIRPNSFRIMVDFGSNRREGTCLKSAERQPMSKGKRARLGAMRCAALWKCPKCGRPFANSNQSHFCSRYTLKEHLAGKTPHAIGLFREFARLVKRCGPVRVIAEKTRIAFQVRMSFAAVSLRRHQIVGHVVLARHLENPRFTKIESISPRNHVHSFCFRERAELDGEVLSWLREAYRVGQQRHLSR
jgi:Domain of unknown function (DUF5655)